MASNVPSFLDSFFGGLSLRAPVGGSAKGMPLKASIPTIERPTMVPEGVSTVTRLARSSRSAAGAARTVAEKPSTAEIVERNFMLAKIITMLN